MSTEHIVIDSSQQVSLLLEQKTRLLENYIVANQQLDEKADRYVQIGSIIIGSGSIVAALDFKGGLNLGPQISAVLLWLQIIAFITGIIAFGLVVWTALRVNKPVEWTAPGNTDWDDNIRLYLSEKGHLQVLSDLLNSIETAQTLNDQKADRIVRIGRLLIVEIVSMAVVLTITMMVNFP